jgi:hypothetical protein
MTFGSYGQKKNIRFQDVPGQGVQGHVSFFV